MSDYNLSTSSAEIFVFLQQVARAAAEPAMLHFRNKLTVENKLVDDFDPVTEADRATEAEIRRLIAEKFPDHGIVGEEYGVERGDADNIWVIDPIDGTRAYISGLPTWGTLVGLTQNGVAIAGFMSQPFTQEVYVGVPGGAFFLHGDEPAVPVSVSKTTELADATVMTTSPFLYKGTAAERLAKLEAETKLSRYGMDCYAFAVLAAGHIDLVVEPGLQPYDIVGVIALVEEAGGIVSTWDGKRGENGGHVVAAATPELHEAALAILNS